MAAVATFEQQIDALASASPDWLAEIRRQGLKRYGEIDYPEGREEHWRFTDVASIRPESFRPIEVAETPEAPPLDALELSGVESAGRIVHVDSATVSLELSEAARAAGVILCDLDTAVREHADLLRPRLGSLMGANDPFTALSLAAHRGGTLLYVPKGVELVSPFQALHWLTPNAAGASVLPRTVVIVEDGAKVVFNDVYDSEAMSEPTLAAPVTEMFI